MAQLTEPERGRAAAALERVLEDVAAGDMVATAKQRAYITGVLMGIHAEIDGYSDTLKEPLV